jgi:Ras GTPase-activating-like protein IQGAP2/3
LSPNTTGLTVESPDHDPEPFASPTPNRIRLPMTPSYSSSSPSVSQRINNYPFAREEKKSEPFVPVRSHRAYTLDSVAPNLTGSSTASDATTSSSQTSTSSRNLLSDASSSRGLQRRPTSLYGDSYTSSSSTSTDQYSFTNRPRSSSALSRGSSVSPQKLSEFSRPAPEPEHSSSAMNPQPYRSSYMNRKANRYGAHLSDGRKLGRHLPRIASGDAPDDWVAEEKTEEPPPAPVPPDDWRARRAAREKREKEARREARESRAPFLDRNNAEFAAVADADDVAGVPGRLRLSRDMMPAAPASPLPSARLTRGLWADVQRNVLQAYEYLCHVGEAQQWIEGCLGEELGFGVVEMEECMRNGVVLAKLVRVFQGEHIVRRIYEVRFIEHIKTCYHSHKLSPSSLQAPKLDFRHSDNINIFFNFVRHVGLPEVGSRYLVVD